jgi:hypothetical protein
MGLRKISKNGVTDFETRKTGFNLAAILLLGREEVIRSCTPNYLTDAILRRENLDRYDDRFMVTTKWTLGNRIHTAGRYVGIEK